MRNVIKGCFVAVIMLLSGMVCYSQSSSNPVKWRVNYKMSSATEGEMILTAIISDGWHLYGTSLPKDGPKPTTFDFSASQGISFTGKLTPSVPPVKYHDSMFDMFLSCWEKRVTFKRKFKVTDRKAACIAGSVSFMSCNNVTCSAPSVKKFSKKIQ